MVKGFSNASWRKVQCLAAICASLWCLLLIAHVKIFRKKQAQREAFTPQSIFAETRKHLAFIPELYLNDTPHIFPHNFRYLLLPDYDVRCGVRPLENQRRSKRHVARPLPDSSYAVRRPMLALFLVHSKADHFAHRKVIRETWGSVGRRLYNLIFLVGNPQNESCQVMLEEESLSFGDILQEDFLETYRNITLKAVMGLKWATQYCPRAAYVVKVDDDTFVGTRRIIGNIANKLISSRRLLLCKSNTNAPVLRRGKYAVSKSLYSASVWPPFCFGGGWIASMDVIIKLYKKSLVTPQIYLDDVYITGILRTKIGQTINRAAYSSKLFCHANGKPQLVRSWWQSEIRNGNTEKQKKWLDCFH